MRFTEKETQFINDVLHIHVGAEEERESILVAIQDEAFEIEVKETIDNNCTSEIGKIAADLVTKLGEDDDEGEEEQ